MKYSEDIKMEIAGKFINGNYTDNLKLIYKDLNRLTKSAISEQLTLNDVSQQRELLIGALEEYNKVKYEWTKLTYEDYVNKYHPNL